jgi:hypothetical protein
VNLKKQQSMIAGLALVGLGIVWWLNLWWLVVPGALAAAGVAVYVQRRRVGRTVEAVQSALWGVGLALLFLLDFMFPGIVLLIGLSLLARGREDRIDTWLQGGIERARHRGSAIRALTTQRVPVSTEPPVTQPPVVVVPPQTGDAPATSETVRLRDS